jgi:hypothetical protein
VASSFLFSLFFSLIIFYIVLFLFFLFFNLFSSFLSKVQPRTRALGPVRHCFCEVFTAPGYFLHLRHPSLRFLSLMSKSHRSQIFHAAGCSRIRLVTKVQVPSRTVRPFDYEDPKIQELWELTKPLGGRDRRSAREASKMRPLISRLAKVRMYKTLTFLY